MSWRSASTVDVKSSSTDTTVSQNMLQMTPLYSSTSTGLLNAAPGINSSSAYGGQGSYGNALLLDGVDTRDPEGGSAWTFFNQNLVEEIQIGGLGAPAEYGGFTGAIINTVTKSGGNAFSGLFSMRYTNDPWHRRTSAPAHLTANPSLGESAVHQEARPTTPCRWAARSRRTRRSSSRASSAIRPDRPDAAPWRTRTTSARGST